ncbi:hypothetical protein [Sphingomonas sp.]|uniref:5-methylcytosine restriction system specificity protein McrC n=1 Tax=Sphingomonas sp. TaxID=28214 RepID=UPI0025CECBD2|nr:hypothetical protein [Sphingomonas sp.]
MGTDLRVIGQGGRLYCLESADKRGLFQTRPDILVKRGNDIVQIIDTKWKRVSARMDDPKQGVSQADVYQMMAYGRLYGCVRLTLLYPHHDALGSKNGILAPHRINGSDHRLEVATIDVARVNGFGERLRGLCQNEGATASLVG